MTRSTLQELQSLYGAAIDAEVKSLISQTGQSHEFSGMMRYQLGYVDERFDPIESGRGKRFRPLLCLVACKAVGGSWRQALAAAAGIELIHNFSLIHDDIEDRDPSRRHRPTVWKIWGEPQAINAGDGMFALSSLAMLGASEDPCVARDLSSRFQEMALSLTEGQHMDMSFESRHDVGVDEYLRMISLKTAALIGFSLWAGASLAESTEETRGLFHTLGEDVGKAFQIQDDLMGIWGDQDVTGKEPGKDVRNRKKTLPVLLALEHSRGADRGALERFYAGTSEDVDHVLSILSGTGAQDLARREVTRFRNSALATLSRIEMNDESQVQLRGLIDEFAGH